MDRNANGLDLYFTNSARSSNSDENNVFTFCVFDRELPNLFENNRERWHTDTMLNGIKNGLIMSIFGLNCTKLIFGNDLFFMFEILSIVSKMERLRYVIQVSFLQM